MFKNVIWQALYEIEEWKRKSFMSTDNGVQGFTLNLLYSNLGEARINNQAANSS